MSFFGRFKARVVGFERSYVKVFRDVFGSVLGNVLGNVWVALMVTGVSWPFTSGRHADHLSCDSRDFEQSS